MIPGPPRPAKDVHDDVQALIDLILDMIPIILENSYSITETADEASEQRTLDRMSTNAPQGATIQ